MGGHAVKPPFAYFGGKTRLAERIAALLPGHAHYVEPFAGSLAVLLAKRPSELETVNDLDGDLMTFWRVLRERPDELAAAAALTPHSRAEHRAAVDLEVEDDLERARRVFVLLTQGRTSRLARTGWRYFRGSGVGNTMPAYLAAYAGRIPPAAERMRGVSLECRPGLDVIADYGQSEEVLLYEDPPYFGDRATNYRHEMTTVDAHEALAEANHACRAAVVVSGYASDLYTRLYADWHRVEISAFTGQGDCESGGRIEVLWSNRDISVEASFDFGGVA